MADEHPSMVAVPCLQSREKWETTLVDATLKSSDAVELPRSVTMRSFADDLKSHGFLQFPMQVEQGCDALVLTFTTKLNAFYTPTFKFHLRPSEKTKKKADGLKAALEKLREDGAPHAAGESCRGEGEEGGILEVALADLDVTMGHHKTGHYSDRVGLNERYYFQRIKTTNDDHFSQSSSRKPPKITSFRDIWLVTAGKRTRRVSMLGLKYVMAKSKELTSKLELGSVVGGARSANDGASNGATPGAAREAAAAQSSVEVGDSAASAGEGEAFLLTQSKDWEAVMTRHRKLMDSGEVLSDELARARKRLQEQVESEAYVTQHFHEIARVREKISMIRGLVEKIADDIEDVEQFLMQRTEEFMAAQNATFVTQQEQELERFEERILEEKEDRKRQLLEARRQVLADAFQNDLKTYQTLVAYQGQVLTQRAMAEPSSESLESVDLVVTTDPAQLEAFYETEDDDVAPSLPRFVDEEEKEEKQHETDPEPTSVKAPPADEERAEKNGIIEAEQPVEEERKSDQDAHPIAQE